MLMELANSKITRLLLLCALQLFILVGTSKLAFPQTTQEKQALSEAAKLSSRVSPYLTPENMTKQSRFTSVR